MWGIFLDMFCLICLMLWFIEIQQQILAVLLFFFFPFCFFLTTFRNKYLILTFFSKLHILIFDNQHSTYVCESLKRGSVWTLWDVCSWGRLATFLNGLHWWILFLTRMMESDIVWKWPHSHLQIDEQQQLFKGVFKILYVLRGTHTCWWKKNNWRHMIARSTFHLSF